ncbi:hypothetical protein ACF0H5_010459 [Mactra antiquata]
MDTGRFSQSKMSEETFDFVCTACEQENKTLEAVRYCVECVGYCCQVCTDLHKRFPTLKNHNLLGVGHGKQASKQPPRLPEFPTERCSTHAGKVLDMYCEKDDVVGCGTCISRDHRLCPGSQIHSIPDMIGALFNLSNSKKVQSQLRELIVSMTTFDNSKDVQLSALNGAKDTILQKITKFQKALEAAVKKAAEMSKNELMNAYKKMEQEILVEKSDCKKTNDVLQHTNDKLNKIDANRAQHFVLTKLAERKIKETVKEMKEQKKKIKSAGELSFTPNQALMDYINGLQGIGMVGGTLQKRSDLYKIEGSEDINTKVHDDSNVCGSAVNERGDRLYISDFNKGIVCLDGDENYLSTYNDRDLNGAVNVCVDGKGNLFVVGYNSHNVVQFSEDGKEIGVVLNQQDGLKNPRTVCFDKKLNRLFVTMFKSNVVKMYELK